MRPIQYFEEMVPGTRETGPELVVDGDEMLAFARKYDPLPIHVDEDAARAAFGGLTAPGCYVLALKQQLIHRLPNRHAVIASGGYDEVRFHAPVRAGDRLRLELEWVERRPSKSRPDRGVVTVRFELVNQDGTVVMSHRDTILVRLREAGRADG